MDNLSVIVSKYDNNVLASRYLLTCLVAYLLTYIVTYLLAHLLTRIGIGYKALKNSMYAGTSWALLSGLIIIIGSLVITYSQFAVILFVLTLLLLIFYLTLGLLTHSFIFALTHSY